ncbi:signal recognition particle-docking protein FtsY [Lacihabitans sp. LS3-19]|uniref:signal recognition particle-docking protein FtsY n=1 Tax=Lacihabitans sp. LS3-19 TaxID=2487335 RepID=UPI0020CDF835|nr:signal recognition particle-docking protein FtsY [Lacihabitans sp. LS3-19]MCP9768823.1 signal recognition particle-docking protein FtsY [Lacihabitans sp. LS3-19]
MGLFDFFSKEKKETLDKGLEKSKSSIFDKISKAIVGKSTVDEEVLDELEEILISSDVGVDTTIKIIKRIEARVARDKFTSTSELDVILREEIAELLQENNSEDVQNSFETENLPKPYVLMVVGVNGVGKTTTIGKLAYNFQKNGKKVVLGAADTFRAAAVDQLKLWGTRVGVEVIDHGMNTDPSSVAYDAIKVGVEKGADVIIIDTAGRLHTKVNLMNELGKIKRVMQKILPEAPHEVMLVLDGSTGQNAVIQAREFTKVTEVNSLTITKLDGTAKGGVVIGISEEFKIPVKYIGVGEKMEDLQVFNKMAFVDSLFKK